MLHSPNLAPSYQPANANSWIASEIADAIVLLRQNPIAIHVAMALAHQLDNANDLQMHRTLRWVS